MKGGYRDSCDATPQHDQLDGWIIGVLHDLKQGRRDLLSHLLQRSFHFLAAHLDQRGADPPEGVQRMAKFFSDDR